MPTVKIPIAYGRIPTFKSLPLISIYIHINISHSISHNPNPIIGSA